MKPIKWLRELVTQNVWWKLLSLAIAVAIWAMVASEPELSTFATALVEYKNLRNDLEIMGAGAPPVSSVLLELRGPSGELKGLNDGGFHSEVVLDMGGVEPGERTFPVDQSDVKLPRGVKLMRSQPSELRFRFEPRAFRTVKVIPRFSGSPGGGYQVAQFTVTPDAVRIEGPASRVERINSVVTDPVDVTSVKGKSTFQVNVFVDDPYVRLQGSPAVTVAVQTRKQGA